MRKMANKTQKVQDKTMVVSGADIKCSVTNFREGKISMTVASCKKINKFAVGFAKEKASRTKVAQLALAAAMASDLADLTHIRKQGP